MMLKKLRIIGKYVRYAVQGNINRMIHRKHIFKIVTITNSTTIASLFCSNIKFSISQMQHTVLTVNWLTFYFSCHFLSPRPMVRYHICVWMYMQESNQFIDNLLPLTFSHFSSYSPFPREENFQINSIERPYSTQMFIFQFHYLQKRFDIIQTTMYTFI